MNKQEKTEAIKMLEEFQKDDGLYLEEMLISQMMIDDLENDGIECSQDDYDQAKGE